MAVCHVTLTFTIFLFEMIKLFVFCIDFRAEPSLAKATQEDMHCEDGWHKEPVEEYSSALRQLVNIFMHLCDCEKGYLLIIKNILLILKG